MKTSKYIQCPNFLESNCDESLSIFLAGGISNCPLWQEELKKMLSDEFFGNLIIFNPRRANAFDFDKESEFQIKWEYNYLKQSDLVSFWFPKESVCPITLLELGTCLKDLKKRVFVGCHPEYTRKTDLLIQTSLYRPEIKITHDLGSLFLQIKECYQEELKKKSVWRKKISRFQKYLSILVVGCAIGFIISEKKNVLNKF